MEELQNTTVLIEEISAGYWDNILQEFYGRHYEEQKARYISLMKRFSKDFKAFKAGFFSAPGRIEIGGNHTDHNNGRVLAAGVDLDTLAAAAPTPQGMITLHSEGYPEIRVSLSDLDPIKKEEGTTEALVRGMARGFVSRGYRIGGFDAAITTKVCMGSGLSSSASFEVLIGIILNAFFNDGRVDLTTIAQIGQYAENLFYGKPCGLMDQMACAHAGLLAIDFENPSIPKLDRLSPRLEPLGYQIMVVNTQGSHSKLSEHYADIPREMKAVAALLQKATLRGLTVSELLSQAKRISSSAGDRAFLRAYHFVKENERVAKQFHALRRGCIREFINLVNESGRASFQYLQNVFLGDTPSDQKISLAIATAEAYMDGDGAVRVHGGGFAGTVLALVPQGCKDNLISGMNEIFGVGAVQTLMIRNLPAGPVTRLHSL